MSQGQQLITKTNIAPQTPYVGQWWHDTTNNLTYVWIGRWMRVANPTTSTPKKDTFDPIEAYNRVKRIL